MAAVWESVADYVHSLGLDAYLVGGAVRDELLGRTPPELDFVVPGVGHAELRAALEPHGRVEDLVVADQRVGVRLLPRDKAARALQPAGIEFTPPRVERSTGPGRHDFEIVADSEISLEQDMERRDFTINAIARRLETGEILDPLGGRADLERGVLRTTGPASFRDDPLRIVRGLRFVSQLDVEPDEATLRQMREWARQLDYVSGERIGGGLAADGMGELSKLLLGANPAKALRLGRDTGVLEQLLPELAPAIGYEQQSGRQHLTLDEHVFAVVQAAADESAPLEVRLAALLHDTGKPEAERNGGDHAAIGAVAAGRALGRLRYPSRLRTYVARLVREHAFALPDDPQPVDARRFLARHGERLALDLLEHRAADLAGKTVPERDWERLERFRSLIERERSQPYRLTDLAVDGSDLIEIGYREGPQLGQTLQTLLAEVVEDPERNDRGQLLRRARELA
jgi:tRNA nucleotidyltransferase (CCA-adding enzyme)